MSEDNYCLLQGFEWNVPADQKHWLRLKNVLHDLKDVGIDNVWLPPACKGAGGTNANGYDIYDLYGECLCQDYKSVLTCLLAGTILENSTRREVNLQNGGRKRIFSS